MSLKLFVQATPNIKVSVSVRGLRITAPEITQPVSSTTINLVSGVHFRSVVTSDVLLTSSSLNRYLRTDSFSFSDTASLSVSRSVADSFGVTDTASFASAKVATDSFGVSDVVDVLLVIQRSLADSFGFSDAPALAVNKGVADSVAFSDTSVFAVSKALADTPVISEQASLSVSTTLTDSATLAETLTRQVAYQRSLFQSVTMLDTRPDLEVGLGRAESLTASDIASKDLEVAYTDSVSPSDAPALDIAQPKTDSVTAADVFTRVVTYSRAFTDAVSIDDNALIGGVAKEAQAVKTNVVSMSEEHDYAFSKALSDNFSVVEVTAHSVSKSLSDSFGVTESISIQNVSTASSVFNAGALNTVPFNN